MQHSLKYFAKNSLVPAFALMAALMSSATGFAAEYKVDPGHSKVSFSVRHLVGRVSGEFKDYAGTFEFDEAKKTFGAATIEVKAASVATGIDKRDEHLRSPDFFDAAKNPTLKATAGKIVASGGQSFKWTTDLTIRGVTKPVVFDLEYLGSAKDPWGNERAGFQAKSKINRKDFGLNWNQALEAGGVLVGEDVEIVLDVEAVKSAAIAKK